MVVGIRHLFISPGHNFFGHHGKPAGENPATEVKEVICRAGHGVEGDRFFDYKQNYAGQKVRVFVEPEDAEDLAAGFPIRLLRFAAGNGLLNFCMRG